MTVENLKEAVLALGPEEKKAFIIQTLPDLAKEGMKDPAFLFELFPIFMGLLKESGMDLQQLIGLASMMGGNNSRG